MTKLFPRCRRLYQYLVVASGSFNAITLGMTFGWASPIVPKLLDNDSEIPMTVEESSWVVISVLVGILLGSSTGGLLLNRIGRKYAVLVTAIPLLIAWLMIAFTRTLPLLICARIIAGIGDGSVFCTLPVYISEISDPEVRGLFGTSITISSTLGMLLINVIGSYYSYFVTALIPTCGPLLLLLILLWMPESPYYLIMAGKLDEAKCSLQTFRGRDDVADELEILTEAIQEQDVKDQRCLNLFQDATNRKFMLILLGVYFCHHFTGASGILFYAQTIFQETANIFSPVASSTIYFSIQTIMAVISATIVDKVGRRPLLITSISGSMASLLTVGVYFSYSETQSSATSWIPIIALLIFVIAFNLGLNSIPIILASELFPTNVKACAMSFANVFFSVLGTTALKVFQMTKDYFGVHVPFLFFAACLIHVIVFIPETKEKTLEEIQAQIKGFNASKRQKK